MVGTTGEKQQLHLVREHQSSTVPAPGGDCGGHYSGKAATTPGTLDERTPVEHSSGTMGVIVVGNTRGKQQLHLEHLMRGHQSSTIPAPGNCCGGHQSEKAAIAPGTLGDRAPAWTVRHPPMDDCGRHHSRKAATAPGTLDERAPAWHSSGTGGRR